MNLKSEVKYCNNKFRQLMPKQPKQHKEHYAHTKSTLGTSSVN